MTQLEYHRKAKIEELKDYLLRERFNVMLAGRKARQILRRIFVLSSCQRE